MRIVGQAAGAASFGAILNLAVHRYAPDDGERGQSPDGAVTAGNPRPRGDRAPDRCSRERPARGLPGGRAALAAGDPAGLPAAPRNGSVATPAA